MAATLQRQETSDAAAGGGARPRRACRRSAPAAWRWCTPATPTDLHEDFYAARAANDALEADPDNPRGPRRRGSGARLPDGRRRPAVGGARCTSGRSAYRSLRDPGQALEVDDEGHVQLALTAEADRPQAPADPDRPLYAHEALTTWDGWSLSAPRPGHAIAQEPAVPRGRADLTEHAAGDRRRGRPGHACPGCGSGPSYRLRVRTVDLAGNAHPPDTADAAARGARAGPATPATSRRRPPHRWATGGSSRCRRRSWCRGWPFGPGEGVERLAIRSTPGMSAPDVRRGQPGRGAGVAALPASAERHLLAAKASLQLVETHGCLDEAIDAVRGLDPARRSAAAAVVRRSPPRENGSVADTPGCAVRGDRRARGRRGTRRSRATSVLDRDLVDLPYLPDPLGGRGQGADPLLDPGQPEQVLDLRFPDGGGWYRPLPLRLRLVEGLDDAPFEPDARLLTVRVPQGRTARLRLSSLFDGRSRAVRDRRLVPPGADRRSRRMPSSRRSSRARTG